MTVVTAASQVAAAPSHLAIPRGIIDDRRGTWGMLLFIVTEACLFVLLFFSYFYLGHLWRGSWPPEPPKLTLALTMLIVLLASSVTLHWGEQAEGRGATSSARLAVGSTVVLGAVFIALQALEYRDHLKTLRPTSNAYGSIFYTITGFHGLHLVLGLLMLVYVLVLPEIGPARKPPHRSLTNAALYWHFVDAVWVVIVAILYVAPNLGIGR
jgi:cytochrome c oxidase subunit 3/cytochrome c oxidase subunit I+III